MIDDRLDNYPQLRRQRGQLLGRDRRRRHADGFANFRLGAKSNSRQAVNGYIAGCGGDGLADVTGTVTIDGAPLVEGDIVFEAADQNSTPQGTTITNGQFQLRVGPGKKIVRINASEGDGVVDPLMQTEGRRSIIPPEFNTSSTLTAEIQAGTNPPLSFAVKKIAAKP